MTTDITLGNQRLLQLCDILDTADERHRERGEPTYDQSSFDHNCGTPACAAGHWMAANTDRWDLVTCTLISDRSGSIEGQLSDEFALASDGFSDLFGPHGCGMALTAKDAATYIRGFVARRQS